MYMYIPAWLYIFIISVLLHVVAICRTEVKSLLLEIQETITAAKDIPRQIQSGAMNDAFIDRHVIPLLQSTLPECMTTNFLSLQVYIILYSTCTQSYIGIVSMCHWYLYTWKSCAQHTYNKWKQERK